MVSSGALVRLRPLRQDDTEAWLEILNDPAVMRGMDRAGAVSVPEHRAFFSDTIEPQTERWFAIESVATGRLVGGIWLWDLSLRHKRAEVRIFVAPAAAGRGIATKAISLCTTRAFGELGLHKLYAYVHRDNAASARAFEKAGFTLEAVLKEEAVRDGAFADVLRYARLKPSS